MMCHIIVSGFVQGIGFRQFVKKAALSLSLTGWVKNIVDGRRVEALFCGSKESIKEVIEVCRKGPFLANVKDIQVEWEDKDIDFKNFEIIV